MRSGSIFGSKKIFTFEILSKATDMIVESGIRSQAAANRAIRNHPGCYIKAS